MLEQEAKYWPIHELHETWTQPCTDALQTVEEEVKKRGRGQV